MINSFPTNPNSESENGIYPVDELSTPISNEQLKVFPVRLESPKEFRDDFVSAVGRATTQVGLEVMQFEVGQETTEIFNSLIQAEQRGIVDVNFHYDRVARHHIRNGRDEAFVALGRTVIHRGDRQGLRIANLGRERAIIRMEELGITNPKNKVRGGSERSSHNHVKLAIVDDEAWLGTMNLREIDFEMSNFMVKVTDPNQVSAIKEVFMQTEEPIGGEDRIYKTNDVGGLEKTSIILDVGLKGQSMIYDRAVQMVDSLMAGDEFILISQWPPVRVYFGQLVDKIFERSQRDVNGKFLISPKEDLHPVRRAALVLQKQILRNQQQNPNTQAINLARQTHAKALLINRADGGREVLFGSHNLTRGTVKNGTRELAMWSRDPQIVDQVSSFLDKVQAER